MNNRFATVTSTALLWLAVTSGVSAAPATLPDGKVLLKAMVDELDRSMNELMLENLPKPYFIQYQVQDRLTFTMRAAYGGLVRSDTNRSRVIASRVRVGSYELDNTNVGRGVGQRTSLPIDDDYTAARQTIWRVTDADYKQAVEILTRKQAYLKQKQVEDRPDDFLPAEPVRELEPTASIDFDPVAWRRNVEQLSARFERYPAVQDANVTLFAGAVNQWIVNSEGTRLRMADTGMELAIRAEVQADDGMRLSDTLSYVALQPPQMPSLEKVAADVDAMSERLIALAEAPVLEQYTGPVLFEPVAAGKVIEALLGVRFCARPVPLGGGGWDEQSFDKKIGLRILPRTFDVYDDPSQPFFEGAVLAGAYTYDDEGVRARRVTLVERGKLKTLLAGRAPTKKIHGSTGHGRSANLRDARATVGCLYVSDHEGMTRQELNQELIEAAKDEGLPFGLRIASIERGITGELGDPVYAYKVFVNDGHEELVRGLRFLSVEPRSLKHLLAAGRDRKVYNSTGRISSSYICPALLFEELELTKIEREFDKPPILKSPLERAD